MRRLLTWVIVLSAALLISSGAYAAWGEPSDLVADGTTDKPTVTASWTLSGGSYTYIHLLTNTTQTGINSFYLTMPSSVSIAELWDFSGPAGWICTKSRVPHLIEWTNAAGASIAPNATGTFTFKSNKCAPSTTKTVVVACEGAQMFSGSTYGPLPVVGLSNMSLLSGGAVVAGAERYLFKTWGKVTYVDPDRFDLNDGSLASPVRVLCVGHGLTSGRYASAFGYWNNSTKQLESRPSQLWIRP